MGLSNVEKNIFKFLKSFHFYLWPLPVQWDENYTMLHLQKPCVKHWGPSVLSLAITFLYAISSGAIAFFINVYRSPKRIEVIILLLVCGGLATVVYVLLVLALHINLAVLAFNHVIQMTVKIETGKIFVLFYALPKKYTFFFVLQNISKS